MEPLATGFGRLLPQNQMNEIMHLTKSLSGLSDHHCTTSYGQARQAEREKPHGYNFPSALPSVYLVIVLLLLTARLSAQNTSAPISFAGRTDFKVGYFGNVFSNQGLNLGAEHLWRERIKIKERRKGPKTIRRQLLLNGSLGYSTNFATQTQNGIFAYSGLTLRRVNAKSRELFIELNPLGFYRSMLPTTYEVAGDDVSRVSLPGRSYYAPSVAFGIGRFRKETKRSGWYFNLQYTVLTDYNAAVLPIFSLHFGRKFNFTRK